MKYLKSIKLSFLLILFISTLVLGIISFRLNGLLNKGLDMEEIAESFKSMQKFLGVASIIAFTILLILSILYMKFTGNKTYLFLSNLFFILFTLYNYITLNRGFFSLNGNDPSDFGGYWLILFIGIFYIIGAIAVSAIGYIAISNYTRHRNETVKKYERSHFRKRN